MVEHGCVYMRLLSPKAGLNPRMPAFEESIYADDQDGQDIEAIKRRVEFGSLRHYRVVLVLQRYPMYDGSSEIRSLPYPRRHRQVHKFPLRWPVI